VVSPLRWETHHTKKKRSAYTFELVGGDDLVGVPAAVYRFPCFLEFLDAVEPFGAGFWFGDVAQTLLEFLRYFDASSGLAVKIVFDGIDSPNG